MKYFFVLLIFALLVNCGIRMELNYAIEMVLINVAGMCDTRISNIDTESFAYASSVTKAVNSTTKTIHLESFLRSILCDSLEASYSVRVAHIFQMK